MGAVWLCRMKTSQPRTDSLEPHEDLSVGEVVGRRRAQFDPEFATPLRPVRVRSPRGQQQPLHGRRQAPLWVLMRVALRVSWPCSGRTSGRRHPTDALPSSAMASAPEETSSTMTDPPPFGTVADDNRSHEHRVVFRRVPHGRRPCDSWPPRRSSRTPDAPMLAPAPMSASPTYVRWAPWRPPDGGVLDLDERPGFGPSARSAAGRRNVNGPTTPRADVGEFAVDAVHPRTGAHDGVDQGAVRADHGAGGNPWWHPRRIVPGSSTLLVRDPPHVDVGGGRVAHGDAGLHPLQIDAGPHDGLDCGQLSPVIDPERVIGIRRRQCGNQSSFVAGGSHQIGEVTPWTLSVVSPATPVAR